MHPVHHGWEVHLHPGGLYAVLFGVVYEVCDARALDQGLRWDAPVVETVAAELVPLHESNPGAQGRRSGGRDEPRGPAAHDDQIVLRSHGSDPFLGCY